MIKEITITSKNQITLPIDYVRAMNLATNSTLKAEMKDGTIVLRPQPPLVAQMQKYWLKHHSTQTHSDQELTDAARGIAKRAI
jgi:bifunctional DNA-binding transcriptional regulator/antitoxin component of YhaV-PrlF toxin-antitoxin module